MPFVSKNDAKDFETNMQDFQEVPEASFGETFAAAVGGVFDEELSISRELNREGWAMRRAQVEGMIASEKINRQDYLNKIGVFDYNRLSADFPEVMSDDQLTQERNEMLAKRREYREDVFERGSGMAQFLGAANGYMLDPISIVTMPIAGVNTTAKGLQAVGAMALKAGAVEAGVETAIQPLVYEHKHDIESPYSWQDALANIATAAAGGAIIGAGAQGIKEFIGAAKERAIARGVPEAEYLERMEDSLSQNPLRKEGMTSEELIEADSKYIETMELTRQRMSKPSVFTESFDEPPKAKPQNGTVSQREKSVLDRTGQTEAYNKDIQAFRARQGVAPKRIDEIPQSFKGVKIVEEVKVKETGETIKVKVDADVAWRRATKRRNTISRLEGCLNA